MVPSVVSLCSLITYSLFIIVTYFVAVGFTAPIGGGLLVLGLAIDTPRIIILSPTIIISFSYLYCNIPFACFCANSLIFA